MGESSSTSSSNGLPPTGAVPAVTGRGWKRLPVAAFTALLIVAALELFIASRPMLFTDGIYWTTTAKRRLLADSSRQEDVLIFGDSRAFSIRPELVADALGGDVTATNYSWAFMGAPAYDYVLDVYLREKRPPRLILVNPMPELVALPPRMLSLEGVPIHKTRLYTTLPAGSLFAELVERREWDLAWGLARHLAMPPSLVRRERVWNAIKSIARGKGFPELSEVDQYQIENMVEHGAYLMHLNNVVPPAVFAQAERLNGPYGAYDNTEAFAAYERFLARARAAGVQVRMMGIPLPATTYDSYEQAGALAAYRALLEKWKREYSNFDLIEPVLIRWPNHLFGDAGHLNIPGDRLYREFCREALEKAEDL